MNTTMQAQPNLAVQKQADLAPKAQAVSTHAVKQGDTKDAAAQKDNDFLKALLSQIANDTEEQDVASEANKVGAQNAALLAAQMLSQNPMAAEQLLQMLQNEGAKPQLMLEANAQIQPLQPQTAILGIGTETTQPIAAQIAMANGGEVQSQKASEVQVQVAQNAANMAQSAQQGNVAHTVKTAEQFDALIAELSGNAKQGKEQNVKPQVMQNAQVTESEGKEPTDLQKAQTPFTPQGAKEMQGKDGVKLEVLKPEKADAEILANGKLAFETAAAKLRTADSTKADDAQTVKDEPVQKAQKTVEKPIKETAQPEQPAIQREVHLQSLSSAQPLEKEAPVLNKQDLLLQVQQGAMANAKAGKEDFVMRLRPDGMGEITVKLAEADGKMTMQITASNANVQKMLSAEIDNLREAMKPYHVEVREIMQQQTNHFDLGSQNPNANQQHFANQFAYQQNEQKPSLYYSGAAVQQEEMVLEEMPQAKPLSTMDIYA